MIYLVTGFMRSGTSAFMQGLEAGGLNVLKSDNRDKFNMGHSDGLYKPNPVSLYEMRPEELSTELLEINNNSALKVVAPQIHMLPVHEYKVILLRRDSEEIRQSFEAAFNLKRPIEFIESNMNNLTTVLNNRKDVKEIIEVQHQDLMFNPLEVFSSLNWPIDAEKAASVIDSGLYRFRKDKLVMGL